MPLCSPLFVFTAINSGFCSSHPPLPTRILTTTNLQMVGLKSKYDFARGHPNPSLLPTAEMKEIMISVVHDADGTSVDETSDVDDENDRNTLCLNYGHEQGSPELLRELRSFLDRHTPNDDTGTARLDHSVQNSLFITHGVSHGIDLICSTQLAPGDVVFVERPTYFLVADIFRSHRLVVRGMPMIHPDNIGGTGGIDVKRLVDLVDSGKLSAPKMMYLVPSHQNPTGHTMPVDDRILLAEFAKKHGVLVVADEVYHLLDWRNEEVDGQRPARMAEFNRIHSNDEDSTNSIRSNGCCISVASFTKIFAPGVRCGWIEAPDRIVKSIAQHGYIVSQGGLAPFVGDLIMCRALSDRIGDSYLRRLNKEYANRARKLCAILQEDERIVLPNGCPTGGYFLWLKFEQNVDSEEFLAFCIDQGTEVRFRPGTLCDAFANHSDGEEQIANDETSGVTAASFRSYARLCFADLDEADLEEGGRELLKALHMYMDSSSK